MANEEHLTILRQGVDVWNRWREEHPRHEIDLREASLEDADLVGANLYEADLAGANLAGAHLYEADLASAQLYEANLAGADLASAHLSRANLYGAMLTGASLHGVDLKDTHLEGAHFGGATLYAVNFERATFKGTNFTSGSLGHTKFIDVDLRGVQGLETMTHSFPSYISIDTLYRSKGQISEIFLRGCGVPDSMIEYARSLVAAERPIDYYSCFISYSSHDETLAERLYADLQAKGVRCWLAPHDMTPGEVIVRGIDEAIRLHDKVVLLLSEAAVTSPWVAYEVNLATTREAREGHIVLYPLRLDDAVLTTTQGWAATLREGRHIGDFRQWTQYANYQTVFGRLLRDLKAEQP